VAPPNDAPSDRLLRATEAASSAADELGDSVTASIEEPSVIADAAEAVAALKVIVTTEVASQLGVTITFSDSDGDG
jgi:hypothetical protein